MSPEGVAKQSLPLLMKFRINGAVPYFLLGNHNETFKQVQKRIYLLNAKSNIKVSILKFYNPRT
jgi:hypothetical protein